MHIETFVLLMSWWGAQNLRIWLQIFTTIQWKYYDGLRTWNEFKNTYTILYVTK